MFRMPRFSHVKRSSSNRANRAWVLSVVGCLALVAQIVAVRGAVRAGDSASLCAGNDIPGCSYGLPTFQYQLLLGEMAAHPIPDAHPLAYDLTELGTSAAYRVIGGSTPMYDAPDANANQVGIFNPGFESVGVMSRKDGWVQVMVNRWIPARVLTNAATSTFAGVVFDHPLAYPMAWVLLPTRPSTIPGLDPDDSTPMLERYLLVNIFATVNIGGWDWVLVGPGQWLEQRRVARVLPTEAPAGTKGRWIAVDLYEQVLVAYEDDRMVYATMISSGLPRPDWGTNKGVFHIWARLKSDRMTGGFGGPDYYNLPDVPWVMYYDNSIALHGAYWHDGFGFRHSHGCVNMSITDSHWLFDWTGGFFGNATVKVYSSHDGIKPGL